jgi:hypothetical protein
MKTSLHLPVRSRGSVLVVTLAVSAIIGISLASYLTLVSSQYRSTVRSQIWNASIPLVEAGIEEALAHLNQNCVPNHLNNHTVNFHADGWTGVSGGVRMRRNLPGGYYEVTIRTNSSTPPQVLSVGYASTMGLTAGTGTGFTPFFASATVEAPPQFVSRAVLCTTRTQPLFDKALLTDGPINLSGNNVLIDSFDSASSHFERGRYDKLKAQDKGDVATNSRILDDLNVWNANIWGRASTGPGGRVAIGPNGAIGSKSWNQSGNKGIEPGYFTDDMNVEFPEVLLPYSAALPPIGPYTHLPDGVTYDLVLFGGDYMISAPSVLTGKILVLGDSRLIVNSEVRISGNDTLVIETNASLRLYANCQKVAISGSGVVNREVKPAAFMLLGTPKNTLIQLTGNSEFNGVIYAPKAHAHFGGGGADTFDVSGAVIVNTANLMGKFNIHYDEDLGRNGINRGYVITSWREQ